MFQDNRISNSDIQQKTTLDKKIKPLNLDREHMKQNIIQNKAENDIHSDRRKTEVGQLARNMMDEYQIPLLDGFDRKTAYNMNNPDKLQKIIAGEREVKNIYAHFYRQILQDKIRETKKSASDIVLDGDSHKRLKLGRRENSVESLEQSQQNHHTSSQFLGERTIDDSAESRSEAPSSSHSSDSQATSPQILEKVHYYSSNDPRRPKEGVLGLTQEDIQKQEEPRMTHPKFLGNDVQHPRTDKA